MQGLFEKTVREYEPRIAFVADWLGAKGVTELERLATASWVTKESPSMSVAERGQAVTKLKPHIDRAEADLAVDAVDKMADKVRSLVH